MNLFLGLKIIFGTKNYFFVPKIEIFNNFIFYVCKVLNPLSKHGVDHKLSYLDIHPKWTIHIGYSWKCVIYSHNVANTQDRNQIYPRYSHNAA